MTRHLIFLDIDGVLAGEEYLCGRHTGPYTFVDSEKVALINQIEGAEIVISSSWGCDGGRTEKTLRTCGLTLPIIGYTKKLHYQYEWACRGNEIEEWLQEHFEGSLHTMFGSEYGNEAYQYVIFDDDCDMLYGQKDNFIRVNRYTGITQEDIDKARKILTEDERA